MARDTWVIVGAAIYFLLFVVSVGSVFIWKIKRRGGRRPVEFKLLRGPGETLRRRIAQSDEDMVFKVGAAAAAPLVVTYLVFLLVAKSKPETWTTFIIGVSAAVIVFGVALYFAGRWMFRDMKRYRDDRLGYLGEREVGEQLMPLIARGYRVFHDIPAKGVKEDFNLDHVAVGPTGVTLIETKTRRKGNALPGQPDHVVKYDGEKFLWPSGKVNRYGLDQVVNNSDWLKKFIKQRTGLDVAVRPILTLPGWWVEAARSAGPVRVVNSKNLVGEIDGAGRQTLAEEQIDLIARQLDLICRDVEE